MRRLRKRARALGSEVTLTLLHHDVSHAESVIDAAFCELEMIEQVMSLYRPESQVCRLNRSRALDDPHPHLLRVLRCAREMSKRSEGAFDITVQPLWEVHFEAGRRGRPPCAAAIAEARRKVDWRRVRCTEKRVTLDGEGTAITLNGIAQGYAADRVREVLACGGIAHALIDCGEINALGTNGQGRPWDIGIQHPREEDAFVAIAALAGRCLATSGDYATRFEGSDGDPFSRNHLFDPRSGESPVELASVSVAATTAMEADALSTAVFVAGQARAEQLIAAHPGADALLVLKDGRTRATKGFPCKS